eukprot:CAMPEP_0114336492 /NCGR_PEP_ID=MMETSP0101-20121206/5742_1 /TAXON_ID=38822 ORGANISM="Pteridomonas danica, Strain PT" /NCGR_SAMPLE_ID=MMETSP0101 /ASSEMBLY_ACC=CAM_ASM_000211 /LENGTH=165 /DNA_ID=CAMNT_0001468431 /DNA_START=586 /DNA_END=1083 /DNA_ORIENTATION=-
MKTHNAIIACILVIPMCFLVIYFYKRAKKTFFLNSDETFMSSKEKIAQKKGGKSHQNINYLKDIDSRNEDRRVPHYSTRRKEQKKKNPLQVDSQEDHRQRNQRTRTMSGGGGGGENMSPQEAQYIGPVTRKESIDKTAPKPKKSGLFSSFTFASEDDIEKQNNAL